MLKGSIVALITPFKDDNLDEITYRSLIDYHLNNGTNGIVPGGTTGESPTLSHSEHKKIIEIAVKECNGKIPVIAGTGSNSTDEAVELSQFAEKAGSDALLVVTPYYNKPTQNGLQAHFTSVIDASPLPVILYNVPGRTSSNISAETCLNLARSSEKVIAVKEASGNLQQVMEILKEAPEHFSLLSGDDNLTFPMLALGASGVISVEAVAAMVESRRGEVGTTTTPLNPGGKAMIGNDICNVITQGEMIDSGLSVKVIGSSGSDLIVVEA